MPERQQPAPKNGSKEIKEDKLKDEEDISDEEADLEEADSDEEEVESDEEEVNESEDDEVLSRVEDEESSDEEVEECQVPEPKVKSGMGVVFQYIIHVYARIHFSSVYVDILQVSTLPFSGRKYIFICVHSPQTAH